MKINGEEILFYKKAMKKVGNKGENNGRVSSNGVCFWDGCDRSCDRKSDVKVKKIMCCLKTLSHCRIILNSDLKRS